MASAVILVVFLEVSSPPFCYYFLFLITVWQKNGDVDVYDEEAGHSTLYYFDREYSVYFY